MKALLIFFMFGLMSLALGTSAFAKPFPNIVVNGGNSEQFWQVLPNKGAVVTCYLKDSKRYPGKKVSVVVNGTASDIWRDDRVQLGKIKKKEGKASSKFKNKNKKYKGNVKLCNQSSPPATPTPTPTPAPTPPRIECGNGLLEGSEVCDDGNKVSGDGCSNQCQNELCGDGILQPGLGEECDDGNSIVSDGCSASCSVEAAIITPGAGFTGPTSEPGAVGNPSSAGYDAKVIAHWNVVPYQTFYDELNVGVVAFHINGIDNTHT